jgi:hypothetical protein
MVQNLVLGDSKKKSMIGKGQTNRKHDSQCIKHLHVFLSIKEGLDV